MGEQSHIYFYMYLRVGSQFRTLLNPHCHPHSHGELLKDIRIVIVGGEEVLIYTLGKHRDRNAGVGIAGPADTSHLIKNLGKLNR